MNCICSACTSGNKKVWTHQLKILWNQTWMSKQLVGAQSASSRKLFTTAFGNSQMCTCQTYHFHLICQWHQVLTAPCSSITYRSSPHLMPEPYVSLTTSPVEAEFKQPLSRCFLPFQSCVDAVRWNLRRSSCKGRCWPTWRMLPLWLDMSHFPQSAAGEHLGLVGWCSGMTCVVCAGPLWHVGRLCDDKEASVRRGEQQAPLMFLHGFSWHGFFWMLTSRVSHCSCFTVKMFESTAVTLKLEVLNRVTREALFTTTHSSYYWLKTRNSNTKTEKCQINDLKHRKHELWVTIWDLYLICYLYLLVHDIS